MHFQGSVEKFGEVIDVEAWRHYLASFLLELVVVLNCTVFQSIDPGFVHIDEASNISVLINVTNPIAMLGFTVCTTLGE